MKYDIHLYEGDDQLQYVQHSWLCFRNLLTQKQQWTGFTPKPKGVMGRLRDSAGFQLSSSWVEGRAAGWASAKGERAW